jgi:hypothetical protein
MNPHTCRYHLHRARRWWKSLPPEQRCRIYRAGELSAATGVPTRYLPTVLTELGWHRAQRWTRLNGRRIWRWYYAPPPHRVPYPPRGRPTLHLDQLLGLAGDPYRQFPE